jgi:hypothetical protein
MTQSDRIFLVALLVALLCIGLLAAAVLFVIWLFVLATRNL